MISFIGMSSWLFGALALLLAGVLAGLHYLRIRPRRMNVITTMFWRQAAEEVRARTLFERFRHPLTFLLLLLAAGSVLLALAQPMFDETGRPNRVVVLEADMSMTTPDGRFDRARNLVRAEMANAGEAHVAVIAADPEARVLKHFDESCTLLEDRLSALTAADRPLIRDDVLRVATSLANRVNGEVVLIAAQAVKLDDSRIRVLAAGEMCENAFILSATFVPVSGDPTRGAFHWRVGFNGKQDGTITAQLRQTGKILHEETVSLKPGEVKDFSVVGIAADGSILSATVNGSDAIAADSSVDFRLPKRRQIRLAPLGDAALPEVLTRLSETLSEVTAETDVAGAPVIGVGPEHSAARIAIWTSQVRGEIARGEMSTVSATRHPLVDGLVFEDALCRVPETPLPLGEKHLPLLLAGGSPIAVWDSAANRIIVADGLFEERASLVHRTGYLVFWSRVLHRLAQWDDVPLTLSPAQARQVDFAAQDSVVLKADAGNFARAEGTVAAVTTGGGLQTPLWLLILAGALALMVIEAVLSIRGKIA